MKVKLILQNLFYTFLFKIGLGWKYSRWLCSIGKYRRYSDDRCMYCGKKH